jgi:hypothetical protein
MSHKEPSKAEVLRGTPDLMVWQTLAALVVDSPDFVIKRGGYAVLEDLRKRGVGARGYQQRLASTDASYIDPTDVMRREQGDRSNSAHSCPLPSLGDRRSALRGPWARIG